MIRIFSVIFFVFLFHDLDAQTRLNSTNAPPRENTGTRQGETGNTAQEKKVANIKDYLIISSENDTTYVDTTLSIKKDYKFNYLRKDNFGLIPFSATITSNIAVTATLAMLSFIMTQLAGIRSYGFFGYFKAIIPHGMPPAILPLIIVVEILSLFTKPFALCIRLFANMIAGHVVIFSLLGLIFIMGSILVAPVSVAFALFIYMLELLVALIQAYIFTMLSSLFIGMAAYQEH